MPSPRAGTEPEPWNPGTLLPWNPGKNPETFGLHNWINACVSGEHGEIGWFWMVLDVLHLLPMTFFYCTGELKPVIIGGLAKGHSELSLHCFDEPSGFV